MFTIQPHGQVRWWTCNWLEIQTKKDVQQLAKAQASVVKTGQHLDLTFVDFTDQEVELLNKTATHEHMACLLNTYPMKHLKLWTA